MLNTLIPLISFFFNQLSVHLKSGKASEPLFYSKQSLALGKS